MIETELKITLDAATAAKLSRNPVLAELRAEPRRSETLVSIYCDTADHALAAAGIALRLRKSGRKWVQTIKRGRMGGSAGLFSTEEIERPAPGGRLVLDGPDPEGALAAIAEATGETPIAPVFETRVRRMTERLRLPGGGLIEFALDRGEIVAGTVHAPILEAEIELVEGPVSAVFDLARRLFRTGPLAFSTRNKAARGYALVREGVADAPLAPRKAGTLDFDADATLETVARDVLRDCFAQIAANMRLVAAGSAIEGPHQLRVGLRRLRTAFAVFRPALGRDAFATVNAQARDLGQVVGGLRDLDVLIDELVDSAAAFGLDTTARKALVSALEARRARLRPKVRATLAGPDGVGFLFDLAELIETRGWLAPADYGQTARLAAPIGGLAAQLLDKRLGKVTRMGRRIERLDAEDLHALRKELKKLRYTAEMLAPIYPEKRVAAYVDALRDLQDTFGSLNDAAMAEADLTGPDAPGRDRPDVQRAVGFVLGTLAVRVGDDRPKLFRRWEKFAAARPFWS
jgi:triphosphatase